MMAIIIDSQIIIGQMSQTNIFTISNIMVRTLNIKKKNMCNKKPNRYYSS